MSDTPSTPDQPVVPQAPVPPPSPVAGAALPPPLPQAVAVPRNRARTGTIIGIVVGVVAGGGAVAGLLNMMGGDDAAAAEPTVLDVAPAPPTAPAIADAGPVATPITLPGPAVQPPVTTAAPGPSGPAGPDTTAPGIQPPATQTPTEPPEQQEPAPAPAGTVQMAAGISFAVPEGWEVLSSSEGYAAIGNGTTMVFVNVYSSANSASELLFDYQSVITNDLAGAEFGDIGTSEIYSNLVVDAAAFSYRGYAGQGQSGSTLVEGTAFGDVRFDGVGIVTDVMWVPTGEGGMDESDRADLNVVFESFVYGE